MAKLPAYKPHFFLAILFICILSSTFYRSEVWIQSAHIHGRVLLADNWANDEDQEVPEDDSDEDQEDPKEDEDREETQSPEPRDEEPTPEQEEAQKPEPTDEQPADDEDIPTPELEEEQPTPEPELVCEQDCLPPGNDPLAEIIETIIDEGQDKVEGLVEIVNPGAATVRVNEEVSDANEQGKKIEDQIKTALGDPQRGEENKMDLIQSLNLRDTATDAEILDKLSASLPGYRVVGSSLDDFSIIPDENGPVTPVGGFSPANARNGAFVGYNVGIGCTPLSVGGGVINPCPGNLPDIPFPSPTIDRGFRSPTIVETTPGFIAITQPPITPGDYAVPTPELAESPFCPNEASVIKLPSSSDSGCGSSGPILDSGERVNVNASGDRPPGWENKYGMYKDPVTGQIRYIPPPAQETTPEPTIPPPTTSEDEYGNTVVKAPDGFQVIKFKNNGITYIKWGEGSSSADSMTFADGTTSKSVTPNSDGTFDVVTSSGEKIKIGASGREVVTGTIEEPKKPEPVSFEPLDDVMSFTDGDGTIKLYPQGVIVASDRDGAVKVIYGDGSSSIFKNGDPTFTDLGNNTFRIKIGEGSYDVYKPDGEVIVIRDGATQRVKYIKTGTDTADYYILNDNGQWVKQINQITPDTTKLLAKEMSIEKKPAVLGVATSDEPSQPVTLGYSIYTNSLEEIQSILTTAQKVTSEQIKNIALKYSNVDPQGQKNDKEMIVVTGSTGTVKFLATNMTYTLSVTPVKSVDISYPAKIKTGENTIIALGIRPGSGKLITLGNDKDGIFQLVEKAYAAEESSSLVQVATYYDENENNKWDAGEHVVPWSGVTVTLTDADAKPVQPTITPAPQLKADDVPFFEAQVGDKNKKSN